MRLPMQRKRFWVAAFSVAILVAAGGFLLFTAQDVDARPVAGWCSSSTYNTVHTFYPGWPPEPGSEVGQKTYYGCGQGRTSSWGQVTSWVTTTCVPCNQP